MIFSMTPMRVHSRESILNSLPLSVANQQSREESIRKDLMTRLKPVCSELSSAEFEELVLKMTREQLRGERLVHGRTRPS